MSNLLVTMGGQLAWLRLFWQPSTLYLSYMYIIGSHEQKSVSVYPVCEWYAFD